MNLRISHRHGHFVFGIIQSGLTCLIAAGIASFPAPDIVLFISHWAVAWLISWVTMLPVVLLAAPFIRRLTDRLTGG